MKKLLAILFLSSCLVGSGQMNTITFTNFGFSHDQSVSGLLYLPQSYADSVSKKYPLLVWMPGTGGNTISEIRNYDGVPKMINQGKYPENILSPADGNRYSFMVLAINLNGHDGVKAIEEMMTRGYRIDTNKIFLAGVSAGAQMSHILVSNVSQASYNGRTVAEGTTRYVSAVAYMSGPWQPVNNGFLVPDYIQSRSVNFWCSRNQGDSFFPDGAERLTDSINYWADPDLAEATVEAYPNHSGWWTTKSDTAFNGAPGGYSMWEWFLLNARDAAIAPVTLSAPSIVAEVLSNTQIKISVGEVTSADSYVLEWSPTGSGWEQLATTSGTHYHSNRNPNTQYYYRARAVGNGTTYLTSANATTSATTLPTGTLPVYFKFYIKPRG